MKARRYPRSGLSHAAATGSMASRRASTLSSKRAGTSTGRSMAKNCDCSNELGGAEPVIRSRRARRGATPVSRPSKVRSGLRDDVLIDPRQLAPFELDDPCQVRLTA
jgi:hypothetical protein